MKKYITLLFTVLLLLVAPFEVHANDLKIIDEADALSSEEESELTAYANSFIEKTGYDIVVYYSYEKGNDSTIVALADDTFDYNGYGIGEDHNGLIMVVDLYYRTFTITTCGSSCINTYTDQAINDLYDYITPDLGNDDWYKGAKTFIEKAYSVYDNYDYYHGSSGNFNQGYDNNGYESDDVRKSYMQEALFTALGAAILITVICFVIFFKQLKNTSEKSSANQYVKSTSMNLSRSGEVYLYTNRTSRRIERDNDSGSRSGGGRSSTHISSSGRSHGGGGSRHF